MIPAKFLPNRYVIRTLGCNNIIMLNLTLYILGRINKCQLTTACKHIGAIIVRAFRGKRPVNQLDRVDWINFLPLVDGNLVPSTQNDVEKAMLINWTPLCFPLPPPLDL